MPRSKFPTMLLQHRAIFQPYQAWAQWGPPLTVRCLVQEEPSRTTTKAGYIYHRVIKIYAPIATVCPDGSKVTVLPHAGRPQQQTGFVVCAVAVEAGTLPVPAHMEITMDLASPSVSSSTGETVILLRKTVVGQDDYHNDRLVVTEVTVAGCSVSQFKSTEDDAHGTRTVTTGTVTMPPGTVVTQIDRLRIRGLVYDVDGVPTVLDDPLAGTPGTGAVEVKVHRTAG